MYIRERPSELIIAVAYLTPQQERKRRFLTLPRHALDMSQTHGSLCNVKRPEKDVRHTIGLHAKVKER